MPQLRRVLGLPSLLFTGVGAIVGAGVYAIIGEAAGHAGGMLWLSMLLAAPPAFFAALCYAEMTTRFPRAGGAYSYVRVAFPRARWVGFLVGWASIVTAAATAAAVSLGFGGYLALFVHAPVWIGAALLLAACSAVAVVGIRESAWVAAVCTAIEVGGLLVIIALGMGAGPTPDTLLRSGAEGLPGVLAGTALTFFVYTGFEGLANLAEEVRNPGRDLPRAILFSLAITTVLYALTAVAAVTLADPQALAASDSPMAAAAATRSAAVAQALGWVGLFSTANTTLFTLIVGSRVTLAVAQEGDLPAALARIQPTRGTPWVASLMLLVLAAALLPVGGVGRVGSVSSLTTLFIFMAVAAALVGVRRRHVSPDGSAPFVNRAWVADIPNAAALLFASVLPMALFFEFPAHLIAAATLALGLPAWLLWRQFGKPSRERS